MAYNPYTYLARVARANLKIEETMNAEEREKTSWMVRVDVCPGESMTLIRGGANTFVWFRNSGKRHTGYPNDALSLLNKLGKQDHVLYRVSYLDADPVRAATISSATAQQPSRGARIEGSDVRGNWTTLYVARRNVAGKLAWISGRK